MGLGELAALLSTAFAAIAAVASCVAVTQTVRQWRLSIAPNLTAHVASSYLDPSAGWPRTDLYVANAGPGRARQISFVLILGEFYASGFIPPAHVISPGAEPTSVRIHIPTVEGIEVQGVAACLDATGATHVFPLDPQAGRPKVFKAGRSAPPNAWEALPKVFPDLSVAGRTRVDAGWNDLPAPRS